MFFKTCGKYTTYFLIAKKTFFFRSFPLYLHYRISEGLAKDQRRISEGKSASWRSRVCDEVSAKYKQLITVKKQKNNQKKFVFQRKVLSLYYDSENDTNIKQKG